MVKATKNEAGNSRGAIIACFAATRSTTLFLSKKRGKSSTGVLSLRFFDPKNISV
jgi:hypothetical protein